MNGKSLNMLSKIRSMALAGLIGAPLLLFGCVSDSELEATKLEQLTPGQDGVAFHEVAEGNVPGINGDNEEAVDEESEFYSEEDFENGFCKDDIYARHLVSQYKTSNPLNKKLKR